MFCPSYLAGADPCLRQCVLDDIFNHIAKQFTDGIMMSSKRTPQKALIQKNGIGNAKVGGYPDAHQSWLRIGLVQVVQGIGIDRL